MDSATDSAVLVLNENFEPLNVCHARRAVVLVDRGKAEILEHYDGRVLRTPTRLIPLPSVIRLIYLIKRPRPRRKLTRKEIFLRDKYTCQYCSRITHDLTIDHVLPRHRGGKHVWDNLVSACKHCNHHKAGRTPDEARMRLLRKPEAPRASSYYIVLPYIQNRNEWRKFIPERELSDLL